MNDIEHPRTVYVRESEIVPRLDAWLAKLFDPSNLDATCEALAASSQLDDASRGRLDVATRTMADCDRRLSQYRAALDAGADPAVVAGWMRDVQGQRLKAAGEITRMSSADLLSGVQVKDLVSQLGDITAVLGTAEPRLKAEVYAELGLTVSYDPASRMVAAEARPCATERVGGGT